MIEDIDCLYVHLVLSARNLLEDGGVRHGQLLTLLSADYVNCEAGVSNGGQEGFQLKVTDILGPWRRNISRVQVVPNVGNFANCNPVVAFMSDEALLICPIAVVDV